MDHATAATSADECFRCGYNLYSIPNENACPECGLLAERSRRNTAELVDTHPRWLRNIHWGLNLILLSGAVAIAWPICFVWLSNNYIQFLNHFQNIQDNLTPAILVGPSAFLFFFGVFLLTRPEGYAPADQSDRKRRLVMRIFATLPFVLVFTMPFLANLLPELLDWIAFIFVTIILAPLPFLLFTHLRMLAVRAHCQYLPHDCRVLGIGVPTAFIVMPGVLLIENILNRRGLAGTWAETICSIFYLCIVATTVVITFLAIFTVGNFALTFRKARSDLRNKWILHDFSLALKDLGNSQA